jgi:hypothetical protein
VQSPNPYEPPKGLAAPVAVERGRCPACGGRDLRAPGFTWWGGAVGPKLLHHTVCKQCRFAFNAKTGRSNQAAIAIYCGMSTVLALVVAWLLVSLRRR